MDCGLRLGSIATAARVTWTAIFLMAMSGLGPLASAGQTESQKNKLRQRQNEKSIANKSSSALEPISRQQRGVVQFGSGRNDSTQGVDPSGSASPLVALADQGNLPQETATATQLSQFDANAAFGYLADICKIGPRPSASPGMKKQQKYIQRHFEQIGGKYFHQEFTAKSPYDQRLVKLHNLLIRWHPERTKRLLICCHHDTRPFADADKRNPRSKFIGANDGGSGVALLCELGKHIASMDGEYGVDFMFFDGEEFVIVRQRDPMFLGSTFFAQKYSEGKIPWKYEQAILVDMVADKDLQIHLEGNSLHFAKGLTEEVWAVAKELGINEFIPQQKQFIRDDHLPLNEIAKIPTCDIIDFDFPNPIKGNVFWHTREDKLENCSAESLGKVGSVVLAWIRKKQQLSRGQ